MGGGSLRAEIAHGIDIEFRGGVKLRIINFVRIMKVLRRLRKLLPIHIGCSFSTHRPRKQERLSFPAKHRSFTAAVSRLRKANVYVDDRVVGWIPQKTAKHFGTSLVTLLCKK